MVIRKSKHPVNIYSWLFAGHCKYSFNHKMSLVHFIIWKIYLYLPFWLHAKLTFFFNIVMFYFWHSLKRTLLKDVRLATRRQNTKKTALTDGRTLTLVYYSCICFKLFVVFNYNFLLLLVFVNKPQIKQDFLISFVKTVKCPLVSFYGLRRLWWLPCCYLVFAV